MKHATQKRPEHTGDGLCEMYRFDMSLYKISHSIYRHVCTNANNETAHLEKTEAHCHTFFLRWHRRQDNSSALGYTSRNSTLLNLPLAWYCHLSILCLYVVGNRICLKGHFSVDSHYTYLACRITCLHACVMLDPIDSYVSSSVLHVGLRFTHALHAIWVRWFLKSAHGSVFLIVRSTTFGNPPLGHLLFSAWHSDSVAIEFSHWKLRGKTKLLTVQRKYEIADSATTVFKIQHPIHLPALNATLRMPRHAGTSWMTGILAAPTATTRHQGWGQIGPPVRTRPARRGPHMLAPVMRRVLAGRAAPMVDFSMVALWAVEQITFCAWRWTHNRLSTQCRPGGVTLWFVQC